MKYRDNMTQDELRALMQEVTALDQAYAAAAAYDKRQTMGVIIEAINTASADGFGERIADDKRVGLRFDGFDAAWTFATIALDIAPAFSARPPDIQLRGDGAVELWWTVEAA